MRYLLTVLSLGRNDFFMNILLFHDIALYWHSVIINYLYMSLVFFFILLDFLLMLLNNLFNQTRRKCFFLIDYFFMSFQFIMTWL